MPNLHLIKLSVGTQTAADLERWQAELVERNRAAGRGEHPTHVTRMWPRRAGELLEGGSIYWVIKGLVLCRQPILGLEPREGEDGTRRCAIVLDRRMTRTRPQARRPFQGWRYLRADEAPRDLEPGDDSSAALPPALAAELECLGVL